MKLRSIKNGFFLWIGFALVPASSVWALPELIGDLDEDGVATIYDVVELVVVVRSGLEVDDELFPFVDIDSDGFLTINDVEVLSDIVLGRSALSGLPLSTVRRLSPDSGEGGVAVTRETKIRLSTPLSEESAVSISSADFYATFAGETLPGRIVVSADRTQLTLFYDNPLPPSARVRVTLDGNGLTDNRGRVLDLDGDGEEGGILKFDFDTLSLTFLPGTAVCGRVFASELTVSEGGNQTVNQPLEGVTITVDGLEDSLFAVTDNFGNFRLENAPVGRFFVHVDGRTATASGINGYYPFVGKTWQSEPGVETNIGEVFLPLVIDGTLQAVSETEDTVVGLPGSVISEFPEFANVAITVPAGALFKDDGTQGGQVGLAPVPPDRLPGELPEGLDFSLVVTVQTDGATNFDEPAPICLPNTDGLAPGTKTALWSFDHDIGKWEMAGPMTVSEDGSLMCTDPGVGILAPGWHGGLIGITIINGEPYYVFRDGTVRPKKDVDQECAKNGCPCPGTCKFGKSVYLHSGEEVYTSTDLVIPGRAGMDFVMERTYRSRLTYNGPLGHGWNFEFNDTLFFEPNGDIVRYNGRSHEGIWELQGDGSYQAPPGYFSHLDRRQDGSYVITETDGFKRYYQPDGRLFCWEDRFGNRILFEYDAFGYLSKVIDVFGREIDFRFERQPDGVKRLVKITDFADRTVSYQYDANGNLVACTGPAITGTPHGNDFPLGRTERYTYSSGFADERLNHNMLTATRPQEVATGGAPYLSWTYGNDPGDPATFDRVLSETEGGANASGIEAGGTSTFSYEMLNEDEPPDQPDLPRGKATITDRNGNVLEYFVNEFQHHIITREYTRGLRAGEPEFYETINRYDRDALLIERIHPEGNRTLYTYDSSGNRRAAGNLLEKREVADPDRGGGNDLVTTYTYEPLFNQLATATDPRGNDPAYVPPIGNQSAARYTTQVFYDYQESSDPVPLAELLNIDISGIARGLGDLNDDGRTDQAVGHVIRIENPIVELLPDSMEAARLGGLQQDCVVQRHWNDRGQMIKEIDAEGQVSVFEYHPENDPDGDGETHVSPYVALSGENTGYLASVTADAEDSTRRRTPVPPLMLETVYQYDVVGNLTRITDPRGITNEYVHNQANEPVLLITGADISQAVGSGSLLSETEPFAYATLITYDANGRIVRIEEENRDNASPGVGAFAERRFTYDILDNLLSDSREVGSGIFATTQYRYDANDNRVRIIQPEGNIEEYLYDERDLVFRITRGADTPEAATVEFTYDRNENLFSRRDAEDNDGVAGPEETLRIYDGFDRLTEIVDPLNGRSLYTYDLAGNTISFEFAGHPAGDPNGGESPLKRIFYDYDERNRIFQAHEDLFLPNGQNPLNPVDLRDQNNDGLVTTLFEYDSLDRVQITVQDDGQKVHRSYDGFNRLVELQDHMGNIQRFAYDPSSNVIKKTVVEIPSPGLSLPDEIFESHFVYDQVNRMVRTTDNVGQTRYYEYDSRDNLIGLNDAQGPLMEDPFGQTAGLINGPGNRTEYVYDGLERLVGTHTLLTEDGEGGSGLDTQNTANADGIISAFQEYDLNSRLIGFIDDAGNHTEFVYDSLDRLVTRIYPDDTTHERFYDRDSNLINEADPNGTLIEHRFDALNRRIHTAVTPAAGVGGTVEETYEYDGLSRKTRMVDKVSESDTREVRVVYDSASRIVEEIQNGQAVGYTWSGDDRLEALRYPGGRTLSWIYDGIDRPTAIQEGANQLFATAYMGSGLREVERTLGNNSTTSYLNSAGDALTGYDAIRRVVDLAHRSPGDVDLQQYQYDYNRAGFQTRETRPHLAGETDSYVYDSIYRVNAVDYDSAGPGGIPVEETRYRYDGVGNRVEQVVSNETIDYTSNSLNQYTAVDGVPNLYDANGNRTRDDQFNYVYDFRNRLIEVTQAGTNNPVAEYRYHSDGRRFSKALADGTGTEFYYAGWQVLEERNLSDVTTATYVYGPVGLDDPIEINRTAAHAAGVGVFNFHCNARGDVVALTNDSGQVVESYAYDDFGLPRNGPGNANPYLFQGRRFDAETGLYFYRARYYDPATGRFMQRDPVEDPLNVGNLYTYAGNSPYSIHDPLGTSGQMKNVPTRERATGMPDGLTLTGHGIDAVGAGAAGVQWWQESNAAARLAWARNHNIGISQAFNEAATAGRNAKLVGAGTTVLSGVVSTYQESQIDMNTSGAGTAARSLAVGASNAALTSHPVGAGLSLVSTGVDSAFVHVSGDKNFRPGAMDVFNNAGRSVGVLADIGASMFEDEFSVDPCTGRKRRNHGAWDSIERMSNHIKKDQGLLSRGFAWWGENVTGEILGSAYNVVSGETFRTVNLEGQRRGWW